MCDKSPHCPASLIPSLRRHQRDAVIPDRQRRLLVAEHYENSGVLRSVVEGGDAVDVVSTLLDEGLVTRLDHAAYLGRELALAERSLREGTPYVQDQAPERASDPEGCGCKSCRSIDYE